MQEAEWNAGFSGQLGQPDAYGISACNKTSMAQPDTIILYANPNGGVPIIDPACDVVYQLYALAADAHPLSHRDSPVAELQHQEHVDERRFPLHRREHEPAQLLRELPGPGRSDPLDHVYRQRQRASGR